MPTLFVKPAPGRQIRIPERPAELLSAEGAPVARSAYWLRRLAEGDVIHVVKTQKGK